MLMFVTNDLPDLQATAQWSSSVFFMCFSFSVSLIVLILFFFYFSWFLQLVGYPYYTEYQGKGAY